MFGDREDLSGIASHAPYLKTEGSAYAPPVSNDLENAQSVYHTNYPGNVKIADFDVTRSAFPLFKMEI